MSRRSVVAGVGSSLPRRRVDNAELAERVETSDAWIDEVGMAALLLEREGEQEDGGVAAFRQRPQRHLGRSDRADQRHAQGHGRNSARARRIRASSRLPPKASIATVRAMIRMSRPSVQWRR